MRAVILGLALFLASQVTAARAPESAAISGGVAQGVVRIAGFRGQEGPEPDAQASGFFVDEDGLVVTVSNLFTDPLDRRVCERFVLRLLDGTVLQGRVHSIDPILNLMLLEVIEPGRYPVAETDHRTVRPGDEVSALALVDDGVGVRSTVGYVKTRHKTSVYGAGLGDMFIDTLMVLPDIAFGGPLLNDKGRVVGINTPNVHRPESERPDPEEAHALPAKVVQGFLKASRQYPTSEQNWLGLDLRPLSPDEQERAYKLLGERAGVFVDHLWPEGPAAGSDIRPGDILVRLAGQPVRHLHQLNKQLFDLPAGEPVELAILREDRGHLRRVKVERRPAWAGFVNWRFPQPAAAPTASR